MLFTEKLKNKNLILASKSPRRQQLLKELNIPFSIEIKEVEENYSKLLKKKEITEYLAKLKATAFNNLKENDVLITADTIVWFKGKPLEKPKNLKDAKEMLQKLSGKKHRVITSVCLKSATKQKVFTDITKVYFKTLTNQEITYYVDKYQPLDKAGSYGVQEWIGLIAIKKIKGSYYNIVGFPVHKFYKEILNF
ncbi:MAG TPA: septum formation protein Maf [Flavobacteriia bacterium]|nr:septum formation protein Maf [Flavobacteriia bacterium]